MWMTRSCAYICVTRRDADVDSDVVGSLLIMDSSGGISGHGFQGANATDHGFQAAKCHSFAIFYHLDYEVDLDTTHNSEEFGFAHRVGMTRSDSEQLFPCGLEPVRCVGLSSCGGSSPTLSSFLVRRSGRGHTMATLRLRRSMENFVNERATSWLSRKAGWVRSYLQLPGLRLFGWHI